MNLSAAQLQRKREKKARKRRFVRARKIHFFSAFGPFIGAKAFELWKQTPGRFWPMRRGRLRRLIKEAVGDIRKMLPAHA